MIIENIKSDFKNRISEQIGIDVEGEGRYLVTTPFMFEDGDHYVIVLKQIPGGWMLTDEGNTLMHLSYWLDDKAFDSGNRRELLDNSLAFFGVENLDGELVIRVKEDRFGDALFNFIQAQAKVSDLSFLSRDLVRSTFMEDFRSFMRATVPENRLEFDWIDKRNDPTGNYPVDCRINSLQRPLLIYALQNEEKVNVATISLLSFERWGMPFQSVGIFADQESVPRKAVARFSDVVEKSFSNLEGNKPRIATFLESKLSTV